MACLVVENLTKAFRGTRGETIRAVNHANLSIEDKELMVLVGPSGCGKTTTLRLIAGLEELTEGNIVIDGKVVNHISPKDRDIAMVFQNHALYPHLSAYDNLAFGLKLRHCPKAEIEKRVKDAAAMLELNDCLDRKPQALSGGQRQRVALGRAMVRRPRVFLLDEPLSNLDAALRGQMRVEIARLQGQLGATMLYVTHDQQEAMRLGHRIAVMKGGVIQQVGKPLTLYQQPKNLFVAGFIGSPQMNFFTGTLTQKGATVSFEEEGGNAGDAAMGPFALPLPEKCASLMSTHINKPVVMGIRPENIAIANGFNASADRSIPSVVKLIEPIGSETYLHLSSTNHSFVMRVAATQAVQIGEKLMVNFGTAHLHFFDPETEKAIVLHNS
jgi:multiple sugar transport system ATP-binding protein